MRWLAMSAKLNHISKTVLSIVKFGGAGGTRTPYLFNAIEALSQLSYSPVETLLYQIAVLPSSSSYSY